MRPHLLATTGLAALLSLAACSTYEQAKERVADATQKADTLAGAFAPPAAPQRALVFKTTPYYGGGARAIAETLDLPAHLAGRTITIRERQPLTLRQVATLLSRELGVPTKVDETAISPNETQPLPALPGQAPTVAPPPPPNGAGAAWNTAPSPPFVADYSGPAGPFLQQLATHFDIEPQFRDGALFLDSYATRIFTVNAPAATSSLSTTVGGNSATTGSAGQDATTSSAAGAGGSGTSTSVTINIWPEINATLKAILPPTARYATSPSTGTVTVKARRRAMAAVAAYFENLNEVLNPRVAVEVALISIDVDDQDDFGLNLEALWRNAATGAQIGLTGLAPAIQAQGGTGSVAILSPPPGSALSAFATSRLLVRAVAQANRLADYRTGTVVTQNNRAAPIQLITNRDIVKSVDLNVFAEAGLATSTARTETLKYGYTLMILPRVVGRGQISVLLSLTNSDLTNLEGRAIDTTEVQLATVDSREITSEVVLGHGETLILSGYEQTRLLHKATGVGDAEFFGLGGAKAAQKKRTRLLVVVTPTILKPPRATDGDRAALRADL